MHPLASRSARRTLWIHAIVVALWSLTAPLARATSEDAATDTLVAVDPITITEGHDGRTQAMIVVRLKYTPTRTESVDYELLAGTAVPGEDYVAAAGQVTFRPGEPTQTLTLEIVGDTNPECDEWFTLRLRHWFRGAAMDVRALIDDDDQRTTTCDPVGADGGAGDAGTSGDDGAGACTMGGRGRPTWLFLLAPVALLCALLRKQPRCRGSRRRRPH